ncbi:MAG: hypothetical protein ACYSWO_30430 [Planctomycetota bacterium]|jgi:hypothetical protein
MNILAAKDYVDPASFEGPVGYYRVKVIDLFGTVKVLPARYSDRNFARGLVRDLNRTGWYQGERCTIDHAWVQPMPA